MATPTRNLILENIATVLAAITTSAGYKTTVKGVDRVIRNWADVGGDELPRLCVKPGRTRYEHNPGGVVRSVMPVHIVGHVKGTTDADASDKLSDLEDDVWRALNVDIYRGTNASGEQNAITTRITESETDEGDPDKMSSAGGGGTFEVVAEIVFNRTTGGT